MFLVLMQYLMLYLDSEQDEVDSGTMIRNEDDGTLIASKAKEESKKPFSSLHVGPSIFKPL